MINLENNPYTIVNNALDKMFLYNKTKYSKLPKEIAKCIEIQIGVDMQDCNFTYLDNIDTYVIFLNDKKYMQFKNEYSEEAVYATLSVQHIFMENKMHDVLIINIDSILDCNIENFFNVMIPIIYTILDISNDKFEDNFPMAIDLSYKFTNRFFSNTPEYIDISNIDSKSMQIILNRLKDESDEDLYKYGKIIKILEECREEITHEAIAEFESDNSDRYEPDSEDSEKE